MCEGERERREEGGGGGGGVYHLPSPINPRLVIRIIVNNYLVSLLSFI